MKKYLIALVMIVMIMSCFFGKTLVMANEESDDTVYNRYYTTIEVEKGDTLWCIARKYYGNGAKYLTIYNANKGKIKNPYLIYVGQVFTIPQ